MILRPRQKKMVERSLGALHQHDNTLAVAPTGCHAPGTPILLYDGTIKLVEEVQVGDLLLGPDSRPRCVMELHTGEDTLYEIRPIKGEAFVVNAGHILSLVKTNEGSKGAHRYSGPEGQVVNLTVVDYLQRSAYFKHLHKLYRRAVDFAPQPDPVLDPYFLGVLLGDGGLKVNSPSVTTADFEVAEYCQQMADELGLTLRIEQLWGNEANTYHFSGKKGRRNPLTNQLRGLGVYGCGAAEKFVPHHYKAGSRETRAACLAGLIDTDGYLARNCIEFSTASRQMADDVAFMARSLGFLALPKPKVVNGTTYYRFHIGGDFSVLPLKLARRIPGPRRQKKSPLRTGFTVHPGGYGRYHGFTVDEDHLYLMGDFTVTHNSGKTVMLSSVTGKVLEAPDAKACILAHRDELTAQNREKFGRVNPGIDTSVFNAKVKSWEGQATFAMVQTLSREANLKGMPRFDLLVIDEAHHVAADSYRRVIDRVRDNNPDAKVYGVTATPQRGDGLALREVFSNVADQITLGELIGAGHLVKPRTFVIDVGAQEQLNNVQRRAADFDMDEVAAVMNRRPINEAVVHHWRKHAEDRKTIVFCSTIAHAAAVCDTFLGFGTKAVLIHGELSAADRRERLEAYEQGDAQVVVNVAVLTEGYDYTPTACIVLLRPSSYKSTLIQMVGRGLRTVDPNEHPGVVKSDCIVLDFGTATLMHGSLEQDVDLGGKLEDDDTESDSGAPVKFCPECEAEVPIACRECPLCGFTFEQKPDTANLVDFVMTEIDLLAQSNFLWVDLFGRDDALMAAGFKGWGGVFFQDGRWYAVGGAKAYRARLLATGDRMVCLAAADDWLNDHESIDSAHKTRAWLNQPPTPAQLRYLPQECRADFGLTRYQASCLMTFRFNKREIRTLVQSAGERETVAA